MEELTKEQREAMLKELGLSISAEFVPFSKSRNANEKRVSLNWRVTITRGTQSITTDYMQGIGHIPGRPQMARETYDQLEADKKTAETGQIWTTTTRFMSKGKLPAPKLLDVMYSLAMDADAIDYATFEDWANEVGFDPDSRKGEAVYRACLEIALKLRRMLGDSGLTKLREAVQGY